MSRKGRIGSIRARGRFVLSAALLMAGIAHSAEGDLVLSDKPGSAPELQEKGRRQADALTHFMIGLFEEESSGPEKALESKRKVLDLDPGSTNLAIEVAYEYLRRGDTAEAIGILKDAIAAAPKVTAPYLALSTVYLRHLQKYDLAARYAVQAQQLSPKDFATYEMLWEIYHAQGQATKAAQVLEKAAKATSTDADFWVSLAEMYSRNVLRDGVPPKPENVEKINHYLEQAAALEGSRQPETASKIGDTYVMSGQLAKAIPFYRLVLERKPTFPLVREKLAECYSKENNFPAAIEQVEALVRANPLSLDAYQRLADLYLLTGDLVRALANARQTLIIDPRNIERQTLVVELLYKLKRFDDMATVLADARKQFPGLAKLTHLQAIALSQAKRHEEAIVAFDQAVTEANRSQPEILNSDFYFDFGAAAEQAGQHVKAEELFRKSIELEPEATGRAYNYLGYMWVDRGEKLAEAEQLIRRALALEPGNGAYLDSLGWLFYKQGKYPEALTELTRAAEALPEPDSVVYEHIGDTYHQLGKQAEAVLYWQKALHLDPENKELITKLDKNAEKVVQQPEKKPNASQ